MSTVLWANQLKEGKVISDESDKYAIYRYSKKLDKICQRLNVTGFIDAQDLTDARFNMSDEELPDGMESTDEMMAVSGVWIEAADAVKMLDALVSAIRQEQTRFGLLGNAHEEVVAELEESLQFAKQAADDNAKFNFSVVM